MQKKSKISIAAIVALLLAVLATNLVMGATISANTFTPSSNAIKVNETPTVPTQEVNMKERLRELTPETFEEAEASIYPIRNRFLLYTNDGVHIMWGYYGNNGFVGTDNLGKRCWGIYGRGVFAGFYNGEFFWGKYSNGYWKAEYLFGLSCSQGKYVLFPQLTSTAEAANP